jgi:hypothetical protein
MQLAQGRDNGGGIEENRAARHGKATVEPPTPPAGRPGATGARGKSEFGYPIKQNRNDTTRPNQQNYNPTE